MVVGIEKFREKLGAYSESYIIIGGTACDLILSRLQYEPRATVDIDMIVVVENLTEDFLRSFWEFVREGGYHPGVRVNEQGERKYAFYRFEEPTAAGYPAQIELLSRHSELLGAPRDVVVEPIPDDTELSSLSAIIMNDEVYAFTKAHSRMEAGVRVADSAALVVLKASAYMNLLRDKQEGRHVNEKDLRKHRTDVARLLFAETWDEPVVVPEEIGATLEAFVDEVRTRSLQSIADALRVPVEVANELIGGMRGIFNF